MELNLPLYASGICAGAALGYGIPLISRWRLVWPAERAILYLLTLAGTFFFVWSLL